MKHYLLMLFILFSILYAFPEARAEAPLSFCINEICSDNDGHYLIEHTAPDYIELRNLTDQAISLDGFFISDDQDHLNRFSLAGYGIPENGYLILAADKKELPFKLSASDGEELYLSDGAKTVWQQVALPPLEKDTTYSLQENGEWQITVPTPFSPNAEGTPYVKKVYVASPRFSHEAGFYEDPFDLVIDSYKTYQVYYTTDGSIPDEHSTRYTAPVYIQDATSQPNSLSMRTDITITGAVPPVVNLKKATVLRAVAIDAEGNRSNVVTNTYFVGFQNYPDYQDISVLSLVADPGLLFDEDRGIYVVGKMYRDWLESDQFSNDIRAYDRPRNYAQHGKEWEIPVSVQLFNKKDKLCLSQDAGLRIHGNQTRENAQKAFNLYARKEYGANSFQNTLIDGVDSTSKLVVRGQVGRDSITHSLLRETGLPVSGYAPCLVFLNGEFWGFYELREKQEEDYLADLFGVDKDNLMIYKNYRLTEGEDENGQTGRTVYDRLVSDIISHDPSTDMGYAYACSRIDMENYITYMAAIAYCNSEDIYWNKTLWRTMSVGSKPYEDGRWRWIFQDLDWSCRTTDGTEEAINSLANDELFMSLWKNPAFLRQFLTRMMDFANIELAPEHTEAYIAPILLSYNTYFALNNERWGGVEHGKGDMGSQRLDSFMSFFKKRKNDVIERLHSVLGLTKEINTLSVCPLPEDLKLLINSHPVHLSGDSWEGVYYSGSDVLLQANPLPGYKFIGWYENGDLLTTRGIVSVTMDSDHQLTPLYDLIPNIAVMDKINYARNNYRGGYVLYKRNIKSNCVIIPDQSLESSASFTDISISSDGTWKKGAGFAVTFPTSNLSSCGMILDCTAQDGCPKLWQLLYEGSNETKCRIDLSVTEKNNGMRLAFELPSSCIGLPSVNLHLESAEDCPGGTLRITRIRLYGDTAEETETEQN